MLSQEPIKLFPQRHSAVGKQTLCEKLPLCSPASRLLTSVHISHTVAVTQNWDEKL